MDDSWTRRVVDAMGGHLESAYRRPLRYGYNPPVVVLRVHGDIENDKNFQTEARAFNVARHLDELTRKGYAEAEQAAIMQDQLAQIPPGHFAIIVADDSERPLALWFQPVPDQN